MKFLGVVGINVHYLDWLDVFSVASMGQNALINTLKCKFYTSDVCSLLYTNSTSIKVLKKKQ